LRVTQVIVVIEHALSLAGRDADRRPVWCTQKRAAERYAVKEMLTAKGDLITAAEGAGTNFRCG
jgi:hypothetical protein